MRGLLIFGGLIGVVVLVASVLGSAIGSSDRDDEATAVTGALAKGSVSRATHAVRVWREPRGTYTRKDREDLLVGILEAGDLFRVEKHVLRKGNLWVKISSEDGRDIEGWACSPADDPIIAKKVR